MSKEPIDLPRWIPWLAIAVGLGIGGMAAGVLPSDEGSMNAPRWVVGLCGLVFFAAGFRLLTLDRPNLSRWAILVIVASFGVIGLWVGLFGKAEAFGGGSLLLSTGTNISLARWIFAGMGSACLVLFAAMVYGFKSLR